MKCFLIISTLLITSHVLHAQWTSGSGLIYYNGGNVGIGTATPQADLHISKAGALSFLIESTTDDYLSLNLKGNGKTWHLSKRVAAEGDKLSLYYHDGTGWSAPYLTATTTGNIGIGTASPQAKLAVNGDIFSKKVKVTQTGWPDYVFHNAYRLKPLSEVEQFIKLHHHLPEIPSAAEIEKDGVDLGDNQAALLKKVEELTLYIIALNKEVESLKKEIRQLQQN